MPGVYGLPVTPKPTGVLGSASVGAYSVNPDPVVATQVGALRVQFVVPVQMWVTVAFWVQYSSSGGTSRFAIHIDGGVQADGTQEGGTFGDSGVYTAQQTSRFLMAPGAHEAHVIETAAQSTAAKSYQSGTLIVMAG